MVVFCAACYNRMKVANYEIQMHPDIRKEVSESLGEDYDGSVNVIHFVELLIKRHWYKKAAGIFYAFIRRIKGCQLLRMFAGKAGRSD